MFKIDSIRKKNKTAFTVVALIVPTNVKSNDHIAASCM